MKIKREPPGTRSEHAGEIKNIIGSNDTTNIGFTSVPSKQKSTQKGSLLKSTQKTLLGTLVFVSFVLFLLRLFCNNLFYNTIELVILFPTKRFIRICYRFLIKFTIILSICDRKRYILGNCFRNVIEKAFGKIFV